ncbi:MAG: hypothetical protein JWR59_333, partial [Brevundimonas sp.]|nr:hypothetical protein [Brevundimonas sp.]
DDRQSLAYEAPRGRALISIKAADRSGG